MRERDDDDLVSANCFLKQPWFILKKWCRFVKVTNWIEKLRTKYLNAIHLMARYCSLFRINSDAQTFNAIIIVSVVNKNVHKNTDNNNNCHELVTSAIVLGRQY